MKKCPTCGQVYQDESLNFCLTDGDALFSPNALPPTEVMNPAIYSNQSTEVVNPIGYGKQSTEVVNPTDYSKRSKGFVVQVDDGKQSTEFMNPTIYRQKSTKSERQGVNPVFAYLSFGLLALLVGGGIVTLVFMNVLSGKKEAVQSPQNPQSNSSVPPLNTAQPQPPHVGSNTAQSQPPTVVYEGAPPPVVYETVQPPAPPPVVVRVPTSSSKTVGLKAYGGNIGGASATFDLVWNRDRTISGTFYYSTNPNAVYTVSGSNFVEGTSELRVSQGGSYIGQMSLSKSIEGNQLCWQGNFSGQNQYVRFCRRR